MTSFVANGESLSEVIEASIRGIPLIHEFRIEWQSDHSCCVDTDCEKLVNEKGLWIREKEGPTRESNP